MLRSRYVFSSLLCLWIGSTCHGLQCPGNKRRIFTMESDVAALTALNAGTVFWPLPSLVSMDPRAVWCVNEPEEFSGNIVNITFTSPVLLDTIVTRGDLQGAPEYVSNVTFNYAAYSGADQEYLQTYEISSQQAEYLPVDSPVQTKHLELVIHDVVALTDYYCWNLQLIGCLLSDAVTLTPVMAVTITTTATVTVAPTPTTESQPSTSGSPPTLFVVLAIALPVVLVAVIVIITAVALGYVMVERRRKSNVTDSTILKSATLCTVNNSELYNMQSDPAYSAVDESMINNPAYCCSSSAKDHRYAEATHNPLYSGGVNADHPVQPDCDQGVYELVHDPPIHA